MSRGTTGLIRRPRRSTPAALLALAVLAVCVLAAVSVIQVLLGRSPLIPLAGLDAFGRGLRTDGAVMVAAGSAAAALGLILLAAALLPGKPNTLPLAALTSATADSGRGTGDGTPVAGPIPTGGWQPNAAAGVARSGLRVALRATAADVDAVDAARVQIRRRRVTARIKTETSDTDTVHATVAAALGRRLERAGLASELTLQVKVKRTGKRNTL